MSHDFWYGSFQVAAGIVIFLIGLQIIAIIFWLVVALIEKVRYDLEQARREIDNGR